MVSVALKVSGEFDSMIDKLPWVNWSELAREELAKRAELEALRSRLNSEEEQELIKWSVELGRKAKKGSFKRLLSEVSPEKREALLSAMSPKNRKEYS